MCKFIGILGILGFIGTVFRIDKVEAADYFILCVLVVVSAMYFNIKYQELRKDGYKSTSTISV